VLALPFRHVVAVDFEFEFGGHASFEEASRCGERPRPVCMVAKELRSGKTWRIWRGEFPNAPPFPIGPDSVLVAYYASAELGCFRSLGWPMPARILDLFTEFRDRTNGLPLYAGSGLVGALAYFGLDTIGTQEKDRLRLLILRGGPWSESERQEILDYCESDVAPLERLLSTMLPKIDLPRALIRGRYMAAAATMEFNGTPIDVPRLELFREHWTDIQDGLIAEIDAAYGVYDGRTFKRDRFENFLIRHGLPWPVLESGQLDLSDDTFREMARSYPIVSPLRELRSSLSDLRLSDLAVGHDGRNRTILSAFRSRTGRNQPSNTKFIFGPSVWLRGLVTPPPGHGLAYVDWSVQEFATAAALSGDQAMIEAYNSGDPYLAFGKKIGALPADANKVTHADQRQLFKACILGISYGMEAEGLARRIGRPTMIARDLLRAHHETFRQFWRWSDAAVDCAMLHGSIHTVFGWHIRVGAEVNARSLRNFPMQANGAEMMRLAACLATESGIEVCAPVHDAFLICAPLDQLEHDTERMRRAMAEASRAVLDGFEIRTNAELIKHPDRLQDERGRVMWDKVNRLVANCQKRNAA
jgi:DNA polymerase family A